MCFINGETTNEQTPGLTVKGRAESSPPKKAFSLVYSRERRAFRAPQQGQCGPSPASPRVGARAVPGAVPTRGPGTWVMAAAFISPTKPASPPGP